MQITHFVTILMLATLAEGLVEHFLKPIILPPDESRFQPLKLSAYVRDILLRYAAALVGVALCLAYRADLLALAGLASPTPLVGQIITGLVVGRRAPSVRSNGFSRPLSHQPRSATTTATPPALPARCLTATPICQNRTHVLYFLPAATAHREPSPRLAKPTHVGRQPPPPHLPLHPADPAQVHLALGRPPETCILGEI
jgi:hypothetical protein